MLARVTPSEIVGGGQGGGTERRAEWSSFETRAAGGCGGYLGFSRGWGVEWPVWRQARWTSKVESHGLLFMARTQAPQLLCSVGYWTTARRSPELSLEVRPDLMLKTSSGDASATRLMTGAHAYSNSEAGTVIPGGLSCNSSGDLLVVSGVAESTLAPRLTGLHAGSGKFIGPVAAIPQRAVIEAVGRNTFSGDLLLSMFDEHMQQNAIYTAKHGVLVPLVPLPNITVQIGTGAVLSGSPLWFVLTARDDKAPSGVSMVTVDLEGKRVASVSPIPGDTDVTLLLPGPARAGGRQQLYALGATEKNAAELFVIDPSTGTRGPALAAFRDLSCNNLSGAMALIDPLSMIVHATLINITGGGIGVPVEVTVDLKETPAKVTKSPSQFGFGFAMAMC